MNRRLVRRWMWFVMIVASSHATARGQSVKAVDQPPAQASRLFPFHENGHWGYIDREGKVVVPPRFDEARDFAEGLARVMTDREVSYIDLQGKTVCKSPGSGSGDDFSDGMAIFRVDNKFGFFDRAGKIIVDAKYDDAQRFSNGLAAVNIGAKPERFPRPWIMEGGKWGFIDKSGKLVIPIQFTGVDYEGFRDGLAYVRVGDSGGFINSTGKFVIRFDDPSVAPKRRIAGAHYFSEGLAPASVFFAESKRILQGFIGKDGRFVIEPRFEGVWGFSQGLARFGLKDRAGYLDRTGRTVIEARFFESADFSDGLALVRDGEKRGFIDKAGEFVIALDRYNDAESFHGGLARVHEGGQFVRTNDGAAYWQGGMWSYIDRTGKTIHHCCHDANSPGFGREFR